LGLGSILTWMIAQFPQIWTNFKNKSAEALSPWFLAEWLLVHSYPSMFEPVHPLELNKICSMAIHSS